MLATRHGMNPQINWGRGGTGYVESRMDLNFLVHAKLPPKSLNLWGGYQTGWSPNKCLEEGEKRWQALKWKLDTVAQISPNASSSHRHLHCYAMQWFFVAHNYITLHCRIFHQDSLYWCRQYDGLASGSKWHPNYPIHHLGLTEFDQERHCIAWSPKGWLLLSSV